MSNHLFVIQNNIIFFSSLTREDPEEARYYANPRKTAMTLFHVVGLINFKTYSLFQLNCLLYHIQ